MDNVTVRKHECWSMAEQPDCLPNLRVQVNEVGLFWYHFTETGFKAVLDTVEYARLEALFQEANAEQATTTAH